MSKLSWRVAMKMHEQAERKQISKFNEIEKILGSELSEITIEKINPRGRPFYTSKMRTRAALADATASDLVRAKNVIEEMLSVIAIESERRDEERRTNSFLREQYEDSKGLWSSYEEFVAAIKG